MNAEFITNFLSMSPEERATASHDLDEAVAAIRRNPPRTTTPSTPPSAPQPPGSDEDDELASAPLMSDDVIDPHSGISRGGESGTASVGGWAQANDEDGVTLAEASRPPVAGHRSHRVGIPLPSNGPERIIPPWEDDPAPGLGERTADADDGDMEDVVDDDTWDVDDAEPEVGGVAGPVLPPPAVQPDVRIADDDEPDGALVAAPTFADPLAVDEPGATAEPLDDNDDDVVAPTGTGPVASRDQALSDMFGSAPQQFGPPGGDPYSTAQIPSSAKPRRYADDDRIDSDDTDDDDVVVPVGRMPLPLRIVGRARAVGTWITGTRAGQWFRELDKSHRAGLIAVGVLGVITLLLVAYLNWPSGGGAGPSANAPASQASDSGSGASGDPNSDGVVMPAPQGAEADCANGSTSPSLAFSNDESQAWQCMRYYSADNVTLTITFSKPVTISRITFVPGWNYVEPSGVDNWSKWRVVTRVLWVIGNNQIAQTVTPTRSGVEQRISPPVSTTTVQMVIQQTAPASGNDNNGSLLGGGWSKTVDGFAVSHIKVYGRESQ